MSRGMFVVIEGADGVGKSTAIQACAQALQAAGASVTVTGEPGGSSIGEDVARLLLHGGELTGVTEVLLFCAERAQHVHEVVAPAVQRGDIVLCSRFLDSTLAYQGLGRGLDLDRIRAVSAFATGGLEPDLVLCLSADPDVIAARIGSRGALDRIERDGIGAGLESLLQAALAADPRYRSVDAGAEVGVVAERMCAQILDARSAGPGA